MTPGKMPKVLTRLLPEIWGYIGQKILIDLMRKKNIDISLQHTDCGIEIYDKETQDTHAGGSGCGCSAVTLTSWILPRMCFRENGGGYFSCLQARFFHRSALMKVRVCRALLTALSLRLVYEHKRYLKKYETCQRAVLNAVFRTALLLIPYLYNPLNIHPLLWRMLFLQQ